MVGAPSPMENIETRLKESDISAEISDITIDDRGIVVSFSDTAFFAPGSAKLTQKAKATIEKFASILYVIPNKVIIEGHSDNVPVSSSISPSIGN